ncbi:MAG: response regulator [Candidatus Hydrogenedentota bacterium]
MASEDVQVLVVTADTTWRDQCTTILVNSGCQVNTESQGTQALNALRKRRYDLVLLDDSLPDFGLIEMSLTIRDVAAAHPQLLVGGDDIDRYQRFWQQFDAYYVGTKQGVASKALDAVHHLERSG